MKNINMDAIEVASMIIKQDFSSLRGKSFKMCDNKKKSTGQGEHVKGHKSKYTLNQLGETVDKLAKAVYDGFKQINTRLDYIVKANNLKDLPNNNR